MHLPRTQAVLLFHYKPCKVCVQLALLLKKGKGICQGSLETPETEEQNKQALKSRNQASSENPDQKNPGALHRCQPLAPEVFPHKRQSPAVESLTGTPWIAGPPVMGPEVQEWQIQVITPRKTC